MTKNELIEKLSGLEWEDFEVKKAKSELPKSVWETVSAFSNTNGGWLVLGVQQKGDRFEISGVENAEKLEQDFLNALRKGKFNVPVNTRQMLYDFEGKKVLAFYVPVHSQKPVYYNALSNTFIRRGSADQRATSNEIDSMFRDQTFGTRTSQVAPGTSRNSLNETSLRRYRDYMSRFNPNASYNRFSDDEFLIKLRILDEGQCTFGGLLMLGKREIIEKHFPDFRIDLLEIPGNSYREADRRYTYRLDEQENLWEYYFECFTRLKQRVDVSFHLTSEGFGQELSEGLEAIREALVNLLMHTDYFAPGSPRIRIFTDRIEFYNPGSLPQPFEELKMKDLSLPRNPIIAKLFRMVKLAENAGFGFDKIEDNWTKYNNTAPTYDIAIDSVILTLDLAEDKNLSTPVDKHDKTSGKTSGKMSGKTSGKILELIKSNGHITIPEMAHELRITERSVERNIEKLKSNGYLKRIGPAKGGYWKIEST